jgi:tetratricopeptide (TPR) repeat protein
VTAAAAPIAPSNRWLFGPARDLLLGCGLGYVCVFVLFCFVGSGVRTVLPAGIVPFLTLLVGAPHYGATLLRVYARRSDRRAYAFFAVYVSLALAGVFVLATRSAWVGSLVLTVFMTWNPWHYAGQNYGLGVMFLRRRGVTVDLELKRWFYASFLLSFLLTFLAIHREDAAAAYSPLIYAAHTYRFAPLGIPARLADQLIFLALASYLISLAMSFRLLLRRASPRVLLPTALLTATQSLWFAVPLVCRFYGVLQSVEPLSARYAIYYFYWTALAHSIQYVWVTSYFAHAREGFEGYGRWFWKSVLAGTAIWTVPGLLFAPHLLGTLPFDMGLGALVAACVNLHHFILDGAIWKLRDGRIARILVRSEPEAEPGAAAIVPRPAWRPLRAALWATGAASLAITLVHMVEDTRLQQGLARANPARVESALRHLSWVGLESPEQRIRLGKLLEEKGDASRALAQYQRAAWIYPTPHAFRLTASLQEQSGDTEAALAAWQEMARLAPSKARPRYRIGMLSLERGDLPRALAALEDATRLEPSNVKYREALAQARSRSDAREAAGRGSEGSG